jgi:serine/threonine protein kinase
MFISKLKNIKKFTDFEKISNSIKLIKHFDPSANSQCSLFINYSNYIEPYGSKIVVKKIKQFTPSSSVLREYNILLNCNKFNNMIDYFPRPRGIFSDKHFNYIVYNYIDGIDCTKYQNNLSNNYQIVRYIKNILSLTQKIHSIGIAHLDIKPSNIIYNKYDTLSLIDLGSARWLRHQDPRLIVQTIVRLGTPLYASPEALGRKYNCVSDVYSIGKIFKELLEKQSLPPKECIVLCKNMLQSNPLTRPSIDEVLQNDIFA